MTITFVSTLTHQDEEKLATQLLKAADIFLSDAEFSYIIHVETASGQRFSQKKLPSTEERARAADSTREDPAEHVAIGSMPSFEPSYFAVAWKEESPTTSPQSRKS